MPLFYANLKKYIIYYKYFQFSLVRMKPVKKHILGTKEISFQQQHKFNNKFNFFQIKQFKGCFNPSKYNFPSNKNINEK